MPGLVTPAFANTSSEFLLLTCVIENLSRLLTRKFGKKNRRFHLEMRIGPKGWICRYAVLPNLTCGAVAQHRVATLALPTPRNALAKRHARWPRRSSAGGSTGRQPNLRTGTSRITARIAGRY